MGLPILDVGVFIIFVLVVLSFSMFKGRKESGSEDYFLAGRGASWFLIGFSLIAANISTEQFVGMSGQSAGNVGLAIASYEWMAAITLVFVAIFFLPRFLRVGIYTIPEYLEHRYNSTCRSLMAISTMIIYVGVTITSVIYSGGITIQTIFGLNIYASVWLIGIIAATYTTFGGLKAVIWADLFQGSALILGGGVVLYFAMAAVGAVAPEGVGAWDHFMAESGDKMHMILPADHPVLPWTALVLGLWIPNFYYWGLNQYITQRTLAAKTLKQGQMGVIFAAGLKLIIPFVIVVPGIMAMQLYAADLSETTDAAYPVLIKKLIPDGNGLKGFMLAALAGAVMSSLASMLNSASTIFTMDIYKRHLKKDASQHALVTTGRICTMLFVTIGCIIAPFLKDPRLGGIFTFIQEFQGFISPGILMAFLFGFVVKKAPAAAGVAALLGSPIIYGALMFFIAPNLDFLNRMAITFVSVAVLMGIITAIMPLKEAKVMPVQEDFDMTPAPMVKIGGALVIAGTVILYAVFW